MEDSKNKSAARKGVAARYENLPMIMLNLCRQERAPVLAPVQEGGGPLLAAGPRQVALHRLGRPRRRRHRGLHHADLRQGRRLGGQLPRLQGQGTGTVAGNTNMCSILNCKL